MINSKERDRETETKRQRDRDSEREREKSTCISINLQSDWHRIRSASSFPKYQSKFHKFAFTIYDYQDQKVVLKVNKLIDKLVPKSKDQHQLCQY